MLEYQLPSKGLSVSKMFGQIEANRNIFNIEDYSVSQTTLDQVRHKTLLKLFIVIMILVKLNTWKCNCHQFHVYAALISRSANAGTFFWKKCGGQIDSSPRFLRIIRRTINQLKVLFDFFVFRFLSILLKTKLMAWMNCRSIKIANRTWRCKQCAIRI
jgi:hypothetical protein